MAKEWPLQNTGAFAPPSCATCCDTLPEEFVNVVFFRLLIDGVESEVPLGITAPSPLLVVTPQERDPVTHIIATGTLTWDYQDYGDLTGTSEECNGCSGSPCFDGDGNPYGGTQGYLPELRHHVWEFYVTADAPRGKATDVYLTGFYVMPAYGTNLPSCQDYGADYVALIRSFTW